MKIINYILILILLQNTSAYADDFFKEVAKGVAVNVLTEVVKSAILDTEQSQAYSEVQIPETVEGSNDDKERVKAIIAALVDSNTPIEERIGLYAPKVDYFLSGVVSHEFILKDRNYFERRWPQRSYNIVSIDEISVDPNKRFAAARYTVEYTVTRPKENKSGTSKVVVLLGSFNAQPRVFSIKEWVHRNE